MTCDCGRTSGSFTAYVPAVKQPGGTITIERQRPIGFRIADNSPANQKIREIKPGDLIRILSYDSEIFVGRLRPWQGVMLHDIERITE